MKGTYEIRGVLFTLYQFGWAYKISGIIVEHYGSFVCFIYRLTELAREFVGFPLSLLIII